MGQVWLRLVLAALAAVAVAHAAYTPVKWTNLYVKWNMFSYLARVTGHGYFKIPLSANDAKDAEWVQVASKPPLTMWCMKDDPRVCVLYDQQGNVAGMQVSVLAKDLLFENSPYDVTEHPYFFRNTIMGYDVFSVRYYLVHQETLAAGGRARAKGDEIGEGIWLQKGSSLVHVPRNAEELPDYWSEENCFFNMGRHYYHNISQSMQCKDFEPFFLLVNNKKNAVHGLGFQTFGNSSVHERNWFESPPASAVKSGLPNAPDCLEDWVAKYGIISLHMYFVDRPWFIIC